MSGTAGKYQVPAEEIDGYELTAVVMAVQEIAAGDPAIAEALLTLIEAGYIDLVLGDGTGLPRSGSWLSSQAFAALIGAGAVRAVAPAKTGFDGGVGATIRG